jgi:hypothetical protein
MAKSGPKKPSPAMRYNLPYFLVILPCVFVLIEGIHISLLSQMLRNYTFLLVYAVLLLISGLLIDRYTMGRCTLIEALFAIFIIWILCFVSQPSILRAGEKSHFGSCFEAVNDVVMLESEYYRQHGRYTIDGLPNIGTSEALNEYFAPFCDGIHHGSRWTTDMIHLSEDKKFYTIRGRSRGKQFFCMVTATPKAISPNTFDGCFTLAIKDPETKRVLRQQKIVGFLMSALSLMILSLYLIWHYRIRRRPKLTSQLT